MSAPTILQEIVRWKRDEIAGQQKGVPPDEVRAAAAAAPPPRDLVSALRPAGHRAARRVRLIAEVKRASPSKGQLRPDLDPAALAREYEANGAAAVSVLTDGHYFQGSLEDLRAVRACTGLPVLCKDFILDPYQVYRARAAGADAILLIVAALDDGELPALQRLALSLGMATLVEVHDAGELRRALRIEPRLLGINNRDLHTFEVSLETTARLRPLVPGEVILVSESGVHGRGDVARLAALGVDAVLVGEALVRAPDVAAKVRELAG